MIPTVTSLASNPAILPIAHSTPASLTTLQLLEAAKEAVPSALNFLSSDIYKINSYASLKVLLRFHLIKESSPTLP